MVVAGAEREVQRTQWTQRCREAQMQRCAEQQQQQAAEQLEKLGRNVGYI